jgi:hypothetical protein
LSSVWKYILPKKRSVMATSALVIIIPCMNLKDCEKPDICDMRQVKLGYSSSVQCKLGSIEQFCGTYWDEVRSLCKEGKHSLFKIF